MENLREILKTQAESLKACKKGLRDLPSTSQGLIERWKQNLDFAIENDFPPLDFIRANFDAKLLADNQIYVDRHLSLRNAPNGVYVLNGDCSGTLHFSSWGAATVYVRHNCRVSIIAEDFAKVFVRVYDEAGVEVCEIGDAVVRVYDRR